MIALDVADLVVIASRMLGLDTGQVLDLLDVAAAERALAQARPGSKAAGPGSKATPETWRPPRRCATGKSCC